MRYGSIKVTQMPPVHAANLVANSGNTAYGVDVIVTRNRIVINQIPQMYYFSIIKLQVLPCDEIPNRSIGHP